MIRLQYEELAVVRVGTALTGECDDSSYEWSGAELVREGSGWAPTSIVCGISVT